MGLHELLRINDPVRDLISAGAAVAKLREAAVAEGMLQLMGDGLRKVREGITTMTEVLHVTGEGQHNLLAKQLDVQEDAK